MNTEISPAQPKKRDVTAEDLRAILHYDPDTGWFTWLVSNNNRVKVGDRAGTTNGYGYRQISINSKHYLEHRLVWLYVCGVMPTHFIDHVNGVKADNRIENLREATKSQNGANTGKPRTNTSGHKGVCWNKNAKKWQANIRVNNAQTYLGLFTNIDDAVAARQAAELKYQGDFAYKGAA
jgi:hypothetical protein